MSRDILVKRVVRDASGKPSYLYGLDGGSQGPSRGSSKREMAGSALGGAVGVLSALTGQHRSLGSLINSGVIGAQQGAGFGRRLGSMMTGAGRKAELQQIQAIKNANASEKGRKRLEDRVERANEAADIRATRGTREGRMADTRGPVRRARDAVAVMRTTAALRDPVNEAKALREQKEQLQALDKDTLRVSQRMAELGRSPQELDRLFSFPQPVLEAALNALGGVGNSLTQVSGGSVANTNFSIPTGQVLANGEQVPPHLADHATNTNEPGSQTEAAQMGTEIAQQQNENPQEAMDMNAILQGMEMTEAMRRAQQGAQ